MAKLGAILGTDTILASYSYIKFHRKKVIAKTRLLKKRIDVK